MGEGDLTDAAEFTAGAVYTCLGFPNSKNKINPKKSKVTPQLGKYSSMARSAAHLPNIATDQDHILIQCDAKRSRDVHGNVVSSYAFKGFSGGVIVELGVITTSGFSRRDAPKLAGIVIEAHAAKRVILGTRLASIRRAVEGRL